MEKKAPTIFKVKDVQENDKFADIHTHLPQMASLCLIIGSVRSKPKNFNTGLLFLLNFIFIYFMLYIQRCV